MLIKAALILFLVIPIIFLILFGCIQYERLAAEDEARKEAEKADVMRATVREA